MCEGKAGTMFPTPCFHICIYTFDTFDIYSTILCPTYNICIYTFDKEPPVA